MSGSHWDVYAKRGEFVSAGANGDRHAMKTLDHHRMCVDIMTDHRNVGYLKGVNDLLSETCVQALEASDPDCAVRIADCRAWAEKTAEYERIHGEGSAIDRADPYWLFLEAAMTEPLGSARMKEISDRLSKAS